MEKSVKGSVSEHQNWQAVCSLMMKILRENFHASSRYIATKKTVVVIVYQFFVYQFERVEIAISIRRKVSVDKIMVA